MTVAVATVGIRTPGNVGTIARAMKNFGISDLYLIDTPRPDPDGPAYGMAGRAREDVLPGAEMVSLDHLVRNFHTVGTTAVTGEDDRSHVRYPFYTPAELPAHVADLAADVALVFGRERVGLSNDELARLDAVCSIPACRSYPVLNVGQAATVVLYELRDLIAGDTQHPPTIERAPEERIEALYGQFDAFLGAIGHPREKRPKAGRLLRRLVGRAHPTGREVATLRGVLRRGAQRAEPADVEEAEE